MDFRFLGRYRMNPDYPVQANYAANPKSNLKSTDSQWRGRIITLEYVDSDITSKKNRLALTLAIAASVLVTIGYIWASLALGGFGLLLGTTGTLLAMRKANIKLCNNEKNDAYKDLADFGRYGNNPSNFIRMNLDFKGDNINIQITKKIISDLEEGGFLVGYDQDKKIFCGRINYQNKEIVIFPADHITSKKRFNISLDGIPLEVNTQVVSCTVGPLFSNIFKHDYDIFKLNRESIKNHLTE